MTHATLADVLGTWARPPDALSKVALGTAIALAILAATGRGRTILAHDEIPRRHFLAVAAFVASLLSLFWIAAYLRGGPRIVDATTYFLQGRALSEGDLAWTLPKDLPSASFRGRFLVEKGGEMGGIFPPGYPLLLAIGFSFGAPMIVGPILAAAIVVATYFLARAIAERAVEEPLVEPVARGAALLSITSAALRYHTADTMSHGATALWIALALFFALRGRAGFAGLTLGFVFATRPVSALAIGAISVILLVPRARRRGMALFALALVPGALLLFASQRAVTGSFFASTQRLYYAMSDGPPDCFRYGFGQGIGCLGEHGEFVRARLEGGYGLVAALGTTLRRLRMHLTDVANLEPLALLVLVPIAKTRARPIAAATLVVVVHMFAYAPFYFDGNYPGGGARFFADVLPIEHALVVVGLALFAGSRERFFRRALFGVLGLALAGFAVHASYDHLKLADRDGGRPMYEPDLLSRFNAREGLVYVDTDHGFALGHDPHARAKDGIVVVRLRGDDRDRIVFDRLDRPPTFLYRRDATGPVLQPWAPPDYGRPYRFEAEAEWPALLQEGGMVVPVQVDAIDTCASNSRVLAVAPIPQAGTARARIAVPVPESGRFAVGLRIFRGAAIPDTEGTIDRKLRGIGSAHLSQLEWKWADEASGCTDLAIQEIDLEAPSATLEIEATGGLVAVDRVTLMPRNR